MKGTKLRVKQVYWKQLHWNKITSRLAVQWKRMEGNKMWNSFPSPSFLFFFLHSFFFGSFFILCVNTLSKTGTRGKKSYFMANGSFLFLSVNSFIGTLISLPSLEPHSFIQQEGEEQHQHPMEPSQRRSIVLHQHNHYESFFLWNFHLLPKWVFFLKIRFLYIEFLS